MSHKIPPDDQGILKEIKSNVTTEKICFVPDCPNTSISTPRKVFLCLPSNPLKRKLWYSAVETPDKKAKQTKYCCEDHFDLENDLENYWEWRLTGVNKRLKGGAVPRPRPRTRRALNFDISPLSVLDCTANGARDNVRERTDVSPIDSSVLSSSLENTVIECCHSRRDRGTQHEVDVEHKHTQAQVRVVSKKVQTLAPTPKITADKDIQCDRDSFHMDDVSIVTSAVKNLKVSAEELNDTVDSISSNVLDNTTSYEPSNEQTFTSTDEKKMKLSLIKETFYVKSIKVMIEDDPYLFIGVRKDNLYVLDALEEMSSISRRDIYLILKKIRLNQPFSILAYEFSISESQAGRIFQKNVDILAGFFRQLIIWPSKKWIRINLPISFRYRFARVESIIDCFEIEIEQPSHAINQTMTWSEYKHCNTDKHLISVTGDGLINFVSEGVSGRCTDISIVKGCGYLDKIPAGSAVLADRGFKQLDVLLQEKNCVLIRPPSVLKDTKSSKSEVRLTKQIASLRIHVERVINRIRNYRFLDIHSRVDNKLVKHIDSVVYIACGLVNLDTPIIRQTDE